MTELAVITDDDAKFAEYFIATGNYAKSYKLAFDPHDRLSAREAWHYAKLKLARPDIKRMIGDHHRDLAEAVQIDLPQILQRWVDIAMADPDELCSLRIGACRHCYGVDHRYQWRETEYVEAVDEAERAIKAGIKGAELPAIKGGFGYDHTRAPAADCPHCNGEGEARAIMRDTADLSPQAKLIYGGVKQTRNGLEMIIADRSKALEQVTRMLGGYKDDDNVRVSGPVQYVQNNFNDAKTAARAYEDMVKAGKA